MPSVASSAVARAQDVLASSYRVMNALLLSLPALALSACVKEGVLTKDPLLLAPSMCLGLCSQLALRGMWPRGQTAKRTAPRALCAAASPSRPRAAGSSPPPHSLTDSDEADAFSGPKEEAPLCFEAAKAAGKAPALRTYGIPAAGAHSYGVANAGHQVSADVAAAAPKAPPGARPTGQQLHGEPGHRGWAWAPCWWPLGLMPWCRPRRRSGA